MKIAILGAGFTGLTAALRLCQMGHQVTLLEKEAQAGGMAGGFKDPAWSWPLEKSYHHLFTSDKVALSLTKELNQNIITKRPRTDIYLESQVLPLDSPASLLTFPYLPLFDRLRVGFSLFYLKYLSGLSDLSHLKALPWLRKSMGQKATEIIWEPLFAGKFGDFKDDISLVWFWARIKTRTTSLSYPEGGFQSFAQKIAQKIEKKGGQIVLKSEVKAISHQPSTVSFKTRDQRLMTKDFDKIIVTLPTPIFLKITPGLPKNYLKKLSSIPHLSALTLILILDKPFLKHTYWLNILDQDCPFLALVEHTNFMDPKYYGEKHILYIGNYLPDNHPYLKMSAKELLKIYDPYLKKINPNYTLDARRCTLTHQPFAQPVVTPDYPNLIPSFKTPLKNLYLANLDMVYPWDRGVNYALELGEKVANEI